MLDVLTQVERALPALLQDESVWQSLYVDYHPPMVERLWTRWGEYRVFLHRIHPCERGQALFHPHPWPSAMRVHLPPFSSHVSIAYFSTCCPSLSHSMVTA